MTTGIELRQLRYFLAVCDAGNISRAALRLHIAQPPLTRQIRQLEAQLGVTLFVRSHAGVRLTAAGAAFLPAARQVLEQLQQAVDAARQEGPSSGGCLRLGYSTVFERAVLPNVLQAWQQQWPDWQIQQQGAHSIVLIRQLKRGLLDAAFVGLHSDTRGLVTHAVREEALWVALSQQHRLASKRNLTFADLQAEPLFWFARRLNPGFYDHCQRVFDQIGFRPPLLPEPADHHILLGCIAAGQGVALVPASLRRIKRQGVVFRRLQQQVPKISMGLALVSAADNPCAALPSFLALAEAGWPSGALDA